MNRNYKYGHKRDVVDIRDRKFKVASPISLPPVIDLRSSPFMPEVWDQGKLGSCVAHSTGCIFNFEQRKQGSPDFIPSRLMIYYNARLLEENVNNDDGCQIRDAIKALIKQGVCDETEWAYDESKFAIKPSDNCYIHAEKHQVIQYMSVPQTLIGIKTALVQGYPISFGIQIYESFESEQVINSGIVPMPDVEREQCLGGHAIVIVGYDDNKKIFICRNSWGNKVMMGGYFTLPYGYVLVNVLASDFWIIQKNED